jgi:ribosome-associated toxin RatA of RatAB toxin-antitoxin module
MDPRKMKLRLSFLTAAMLLCALPASASVPSLRAKGLNPVSLAKVIGDSQMMLIHDAQDYAWLLKGKTLTKKAVFISSMKVVAAPLETVRTVVYDVAKYAEFISEINDVKAGDEAGLRIAAFKTQLNMMVLTAGVDYTLAYKHEENGDITWRLEKGDLDAHVGRWEFFELPDGKTLVAMTYWQDIASAGFKISMVLRAQPDMRLVLPVAWAAVVMDSICKRAEGLPPTEQRPRQITQSKPRIPMLAGGNAAIPVADLRNLAEAGTIMLIHPLQWFVGTDKKPTDFLFMGAAALVDTPADQAKKLATDFPRFPEFLDQVVSIVPAEAAEGRRRYDFTLSVGISVFSVDMKYQLEYTDLTPLAMRYERSSGDLAHVYGAWEFFEAGDGKSLIVYTTGNKMGEDGPALLKLGRGMANRDLIVGVSATALTMQKLVPWVNDKASRGKQ